MKKILVLFIIVMTLVGLCSCGESKYEPVPSTDEEVRVVMTFSADGQSYQMKYELYRALFIGNKAIIDGGDDSVWQGESKDEYISRINEIIIDRAADIYSVIHTAKKLGIDLYSADVDNEVQEYIKIAIEGNGSTVTGHGSYESYLNHLAEQGINYAVSDLMIRYSYGLEKINEHYAGTETVLGDYNGKLEYTEDDLLAFYNGDDCARILRAYFQNGVRTEEEMQRFRNNLAAQNLNTDKALYIIQNTLATSSELVTPDGTVTGVVVGRYALDEIYYSEFTKAAFELEDGDVSGLIKISGTSDIYTNGYYVLVGIDKDDAYYASHKDEIEDAFISNEIGKILNSSKQALKLSQQYYGAYSDINHAEISAD